MEKEKKDFSKNSENIEMDTVKKDEDKIFNNNNLNVDEIFKDKNDSLIKKYKKEIIISFFTLIVFILMIYLILKLIFNEEKEIIIDNDNKCEIGEKKKCLICDEQEKECIKCYPGYNLINNKCLVNFSIKAIYQTKYKNEKIKIMNNFTDEIKEMIVDNLTINSSMNYTY